MRQSLGRLCKALVKRAMKMHFLHDRLNCLTKVISRLLGDHHKPAWDSSASEDEWAYSSMSVYMCVRGCFKNFCRILAGIDPILQQARFIWTRRGGIHPHQRKSSFGVGKPKIPRSCGDQVLKRKQKKFFWMGERKSRTPLFKVLKKNLLKQDSFFPILCFSGVTRFTSFKSPHYALLFKFTSLCFLLKFKMHFSKWMPLLKWE